MSHDHFGHGSVEDHAHHGDHMGHGDPTSDSMLVSDTPTVPTKAIHVMEMMQMSFHFGTKELLLFDFWQVDSVLGMILSCVLIFIFAFTYEALKTLRLYLAHRAYRARYTAVRTVNGLAGSATGTPEEEIAIRSGLMSAVHLQQTGLYMVQLTLAYLLMLLFMCFNVWVCISIVLGAGAGYFTFGWYCASKTFMLGDHCTA